MRTVVAVRPVIPLDTQRYGHDPRVISITPTPGGGSDLELCGERVAVPAAYVAGRDAEGGLQGLHRLAEVELEPLVDALLEGEDAAVVAFGHTGRCAPRPRQQALAQRAPDERAASIWHLVH